MWSYYGSKYKLVSFYPKPKYSLIIEPFAGAAWYSITYRKNLILLNEKDFTVFNIWNWLLKKATPELLTSITDFYKGQNIKDIPLSKEHKDLIGFCINRGSVSPRQIVQKWSCQVKSNPEWASTVSYQLKRIARILPEIKHWGVEYGDYSLIPNVKATWFIDPPYQHNGRFYKECKIDYLHLSDWCKHRKGQVIVCESTGDWLPFTPLIKKRGQRKLSQESIWYKE